MNSTRGVMPRVARSLRTQSRSPVKPRDRTSITTASWVIRDPAARPRSTIRAISSGGRLSATYQPRSSSTFAAVPRPAPDRPVTRTTSIPDSSARVAGPAGLLPCRSPSSRMPCSSCSSLRHRTVAPSFGVWPIPLRSAPGWSAGTPSASSTAFAVATPMPGTAVISSTVACLQPGQRSEVRHERLAPVLPQPAHRVQRRGRHPLGPLAAVVGDREAVRLVADPLQQVEPLAVPRQDDRVGSAGTHTSSSRLASPITATSVTPSSSSTACGRVDLRGAAVDDEQVGRVGELARLRLRRQAHSGVCGVRHVAREASPGDLGDRCHVVGATVAGGLRGSRSAGSRDLRGRPSSNTTSEATTSVPWTWLMSTHSMRSGASASPSAS